MKNEKYAKNARYTVVMAGLLLGVVLLMAVNVCIGSVAISITDVCKIVFGHRMVEGAAYDIVMSIRFPRAVAAVVLGGALALAGYLLQCFFRNPIAGPFVLGISSGAKLVVALTLVATLSLGIKLTSITMILAAFLGAMASMCVVLILSKAVEKMSMLIVAGVMIGYICSAVTDLVITFADDSNIVNLHNWSLGSFSGITWSNVIVMSIVVGVVFVWIFAITKPIGAYQLGEAYAKNLGVNVKTLKIFMVIASSLLAACVTAFAGPISFVGIAVPHLVKNLLRTTKPIWLVPASFLGGGVFCLFCDFLSRMLFAPTELSISTVTAILGAPVVIYIMIRRKKGEV